MDLEKANRSQPLSLEWYHISEEFGFVLPEPLVGKSNPRQRQDCGNHGEK